MKKTIKLKIKGIKGDKGDTPSTDELVSIITPLIPEPIKGDKGEKPTADELLEIISPLIPEPIKGEDGHTPTEKEIVSIIKPLIPKPIKGDKGEDGKDVDENVINDIQAKVNRALDISSRDYDLSELKDVSPSIANATNGQVLKKNSTTGLWEAGNDTGSTSFITLTDTPSTYSGQAGKYPVVNGTETGLEFGTITPPATPSLQQVTDVGATTTNNITANSFIKTGGTSSEFLKADGSVDTTSYYPSSNPSGYTSNTGTVTGTGTTNELTYFTGSSSIGSLPVATYPSLTELSYVKGVTSAIQTQINTKESALTFSTGLTRATNTITNNLSTGVSGGQSVIGGTAASNALTLSSTSNATKGKIIMGTGFAYHENTQRLSVGGTTDLGFTLGVAGTLAAQQSVYFAQNSGNVTFCSSLNTVQVYFSVKQSSNTGLGWIFVYDSLSTN